MRCRRRGSGNAQMRTSDLKILLLEHIAAGWLKPDIQRAVLIGHSKPVRAVGIGARHS